VSFRLAWAFATVLMCAAAMLPCHAANHHTIIHLQGGAGHAAGIQLAYALFASAVPVSYRPEDDSTRLDFGDSTNLDIPSYVPYSTTNRKTSSRYQRTNRYLPTPNGLSLYGSIDSTLKSVRLSEGLDGYDVGTSYSLSMDDYLFSRRDALADKVRDSSLWLYEMKKPLTGTELSKLLDQATNLTIPLPQSPLFGIFGKPEISINVNGEVNVRAGWRWDTQRLGTASVLGQTQSSPIFNQNIQVNVGARIGDKFRLNVDWNTLNQFEFNNRFKVGFEGYDDDIIKKVEFGNVNLETQSSLIGGGQTLFGIRADFQFGPLMLKTIASQRRGDRKFINAKGGSATQFFTVRAYDYARNHFFVDTSYFAVWRDYFASVTPALPPSSAQLVIKEIEVWESTNDLKDVTANEAIAYAELDPVLYERGQTYPDAMRAGEIKAGLVERGRFIKLDSKRYDVDLNLGTVSVLSLRNDRYYAVSYRTEGATTVKENKDDLYYGTLTGNAAIKDTLILKLISRPAMQPGFKVLWSRMMKNRYNIGISNVSAADAKIGMWYYRGTNDSADVLQGAPDKIVTIFRVDQVNNGTGAIPPDGAFDARPPVFNSVRGEITFPNLEPFRAGLREYFAAKGNPQLAEQYVFNEVYDTTDWVAKQNSAKDRFLIVGEAAGTASGNRIPLEYNLAPGSVRVTLDGQQLREGTDYTVDYYTGSLLLMNPRATLPNANLNVEYEKNDIFNLTTRTLVGMRADLQLFKRRNITGVIGMTLMNYDQAAVVDRVQPGQEPNANFMMGFDTKITADLPWLTRALDDLPFLDTKAKSSFTMNGEWAMTSPNPNKRTSSVVSDNGRAVAYVDDFESARRFMNFGLTPGVWTHSSASQDKVLWQSDTMAANYRGRSFWYQKFVPDVPQIDVYPNRALVQGRQYINPIRVVFNPYERGIYNKNPEFIDPDNPRWVDDDSLDVRAGKDRFMAENVPKIWGGMMRLLSPFNTNFDNDNIDYIEIMMRIDAHEPGSRMFIDLGQISEDVIPDQRLNTEDKPPANNLIDIGEDVGLDTIPNAIEKETYPFPLNLEADPARDDYNFNFNANRQDQSEGDFVKYNNYENNSTQSELGQFPDTEILNRNNGQTISLDNSFFRYEIKLNPNPNSNPQIVGGNPDKGWFLFRIPIRRPDTIVGNPLFTNIQYVRATFQGGVVKLTVADWGVVGSYWLRNHNYQAGIPITDSVLQIAYVNREEHAFAPDFYTMPPGVVPPRQLQNPDPYQSIYYNEQSISVKVTNLRYGEERMAARIYRPWDLFYYKEVAFFIHGDNTMPDRVSTGATQPAYTFIRFGVDSANYYEYRRPLLRGWQDLRVIVKDLTAVKELRDHTRTNDRQEFPAPGDPDGTYAIKGNPILTRVSFFAFGVANPVERYPNELTTTIWVDELRVVEPQADNDWAAVGGATLKLADLADVTASINHSTPNYHRLEERFGNRLNATTWNFTVTSSLDKFLPKDLAQTRIPVSYSHSEYAETPQYQAQNDVQLETAALAAQQDTIDKGANQTQAQQTYSNVLRRSQRVVVEDQWAVTGMKLGLPSKDWFIDDTFNKLTFSFAYAQMFERSQVVQDRFKWHWNLKIDYAVTLPNKYDVSPLKFFKDVWGLKAYKDYKINFLPQNITANLGLNRGRTTEQSRYLDFPSPIIREFIADKSFGFNWRLSENGLLSPVLDYRVQSASTLVPLELDKNGNQRTAGAIADEMFFNNGRFINLGQDNNYNQTITVAFRPKLPDVFGINRLLETNGSYNVSFNLMDPLQPNPALRDIVRSAKWTSQLRISPIFRWKQFGTEIFGAPVKSPIGFFPVLGEVLQDVFFGFDNLTLTFTQNNTSSNTGVMGGTGFSNLWARTLTFRGNDPMWGPSTPYQLGLIGDPHGAITLHSSSAFPFFRFESSTGLRPANGIMTDDYSQRSSFVFQTNRPLWPGATLDLNMKTDVGYSLNQRVVTDAFGVPEFTNVNKRLTLERSFISFPDWFPFTAFNDNIENVIQLYRERKAVIETIADTTFKNQKLLDALNTSFREGFESLQLFSGELARIMPALNWTLRWDGIEKFPLFSGLAQRIFLEHGYISSYSENAKITDNGRVVEIQQVRSGFQPLISLNLQFDEKKLDGMLTATLRYNTTTAHTLSGSARSAIQLENTHELQIQATYLKRGFSLKFLGLDLKNDLELTFLTQLRKNTSSRYDVDTYDSNEPSIVNGTTQIVIEPRARYTISNRVTASAFVRYEGNFTEGASTPGFSTTQVGVDIRLSISGGR